MVGQSSPGAGRRGTRGAALPAPGGPAALRRPAPPGPLAGAGLGAPQDPTAAQPDAPRCRPTSALPRPGQHGVPRRVHPLNRQFGSTAACRSTATTSSSSSPSKRTCIAGRVLEVGDSEYTGGSAVSCRAGRRAQHRSAAPETTVVADLAERRHVPSNRLRLPGDHATLHLLYDLYCRSADPDRILSPGGTVCHVSRDQPDQHRPVGRVPVPALTPLSAARLFGDVFGPDNVEVRAFGNVLSSVAFLEGMATRRASLIASSSP